MSEVILNSSTLAGSRLRLLKFEIQGLYNEFNYVIPLDVRRHVTAIIAPNGSGKTLCLRLINALFDGDWLQFERTDFLRVTFTFNDGSLIFVTKPQTQPELEEDDSFPASVQIDMTSSEGTVHETWMPHKRKVPQGVFFEQYLPHLMRVSRNSWMDRRTSETLSLGEIMENYSRDIPASVLRRYASKPPEHLQRYIREINCKLIETQRLIILGDPEDGRLSSRDTKKTQFAISRKASTLREIISAEMNRYAALSQSLDRSFPARVIMASQQPPQHLPQQEIEGQLLLLDTKRKKLMDVGILDSEQDVSMALPNQQLDPEIARVLGVYIEDNNKKLDSLDGIYERIALFKKLIDARFGKKDVKVSKQKGLNVIYGDREVPIETLSSGEQHQLVLFFELLFETEKNSLILIDEPEISLHVSWQKKFISDLMSIIDLNKFDVVLATHSPQLIGKWADLVVELGDVFDGDVTPDWTGSAE